MSRSGGLSLDELGEVLVPIVESLDVKSLGRLAQVNSRMNEAATRELKKRPELRAAAEPVDLPDSKDVGGDTAALLLESVLGREDLPPAVRFEAAVWQFVVTELTEADVLATIAVDEHLAELLSLHDFGEEKRDVVTDDVIRKIEDAVQTTLRVSSSNSTGIVVGTPEELIHPSWSP